ncbi:MAG: hypothetical protein AAB394_04450 [Patescibacteria group bacterium]
MMCFREGCPNGVDGPGSIEIGVEIGTRGSIGDSRAKVSAWLCSIKCAILFLVDNSSQGEILEKILKLSKGRTDHT